MIMMMVVKCMIVFKNLAMQNIKIVNNAGTLLPGGSGQGRGSQSYDSIFLE